MYYHQLRKTPILGDDYGSLRRTFQFLFPISIKGGYTEFECLSSASLNNRTTIYNQSQGPNPTGNILHMLDSKRRLVVLMLCILLSNKKSVEMAYMSKMELGIEIRTHQLCR